MTRVNSDMESPLLKIINFSSMPQSEIMPWCETVFPGRIVKFLAPHDKELNQDAPVLMFYDGLVRRLQTVDLTHDADLETAVESWKQDAQSVVDSVRLNVANRLCLETDSVGQAKDALQAVLGAPPSRAVPLLRRDVPNERPVALFVALLLQQDAELSALQASLAEAGGGLPAVKVDKQTIFAAMSLLTRALSSEARMQHAVLEREDWLNRLRKTAWEANTRAQDAEAKLRVATARLEEQSKQVVHAAAELEQTKARLQNHVSEQNVGLQQNQHEHLEAHHEIEHLKAHIEALYNSTSWRLMAPMRKLKLMLSSHQ